jgi:hypothetical protein
MSKSTQLAVGGNGEPLLKSSVATPQKSLSGDFHQNWYILAGDWKVWREISCPAPFQRVKN